MKVNPKSKEKSVFLSNVKKFEKENNKKEKSKWHNNNLNLPLKCKQLCYNKMEFMKHSLELQNKRRNKKLTINNLNVVVNLCAKLKIESLMIFDHKILTKI